MFVPQINVESDTHELDLLAVLLPERGLDSRYCGELDILRSKIKLGVAKMNRRE